MYKGGSRQALRRWLGERDREAYWGGLRYAAFLSTRDHDVLSRYQDDKKRVAGERAALVNERVVLIDPRALKLASAYLLQEAIF